MCDLSHCSKIFICIALKKGMKLSIQQSTFEMTLLLTAELEPPLKFHHRLQGSQLGLYLQTKVCNTDILTNSEKFWSVFSA